MAKPTSSTGDRKRLSLNDIKIKFAPQPPQMDSSGIMYFDILLGGGLPRGSIIELAGPTGLGKSTLCANISRNYCGDRRKVQWWDYEHALTNGLKDSTGLAQFEGENFHHLTPITYGDGEEILESMKIDELPDLIIVDSETGMLPDKMREGSILDQEPGVKSRLCSNFLQKYKGWIRKNGVTMVFINQMRTKIGAGFKQVVEDSAGGNAFKFYADIRLRMRKGADIVRQEITPEGEKKVIYGAEAIIWAIKNREAKSHVELTMPIIFGKGVSNLQILKNILVGAGLVVQAGSYFKIAIDGIYEGNVQGNKGLIEVLKGHRMEIENLIRERELAFLSREKGE